MPKIKNQNKSISAFTLIEMMIVLVIIGILLMATLYLSGEQIQRVKDKTVKESILAERQSRYSRNLWSSSYAWKMYKYLDISIASGENKIEFEYEPKSGEEDDKIINEFTDRFSIKNIIINPDDPNPESLPDITFRYYPYQIACERWSKEEDDNNFDTGKMLDKLLFIARVNDSKDYCFEINKKNCRLMEVSNERCGINNTLVN